MMSVGEVKSFSAIDASESPTTDDAFLGGLLQILQPKVGYRAGLDAVLLAAACRTAAGETARVLDLGAGVGTAGLCLARRVRDARVVLAEKSAPALKLAEANISRNGLEGRVETVAVDILMPASDLDAAGLARESFTHVIANPPYHERHRGTSSQTDMKDDANVMDADDLDHWFRVMARVTAPRGLATIVHKAEALDVALAGFKGRFGRLRVLPIVPRAGALAHRIIMSGVKGSRAPLKLLSPLVLHGEGHAFLPQAEQVLRHGKALDLDAMIC